MTAYDDAGHHHYLKGLGFWPVPISWLGELIPPSHWWSTSISSSFRVVAGF
jgi:hypothetical protein